MYEFIHATAHMEVREQLTVVASFYHMVSEFELRLSGLASCVLPADPSHQSQIIYFYLSQFWSLCISKNLSILSWFNSFYFHKVNSHVPTFISNFINLSLLSLSVLVNSPLLKIFQILF